MPRPFKHPKSGVYTVRVIVPKALRSALGRREFWKTLGTKNPTEAKRLAPAATSALMEQVAEAQRWLAAGVRVEPVAPAEGVIRRLRAPVPGSLSIPTEEDVRQAVRAWLHDGLRRDMAEPAPEGDLARDQMAAEIGAELDNLKTDQRGHDVEHTLHVILEGFGFTPPPLALRPVALGLMRDASMERSQIALDQMTGQAGAIVIRNPVLADASPLAAAPPRPVPRKPVLKVAALMTMWAAEAQPPPGTLKKYTGALKRMAKATGRDDVTRWSIDDVVKFKATRIADGIAPKTVADDVLAGSAVFRWAVKNRHVERNVFEGLAQAKRRQKGERSRQPYSNEDAKMILTAARAETGWKRWLPWLQAFSGARISEIADMHRGHVRKVAGVWILDIVPTPERPLKTKDSQRMVPIHLAVIAEGFLDYVETLPADPAGPLFPDLSPNEAGSRTPSATAYTSKWLRGTVGIKDSAKAPSHSWRHRLEDQMRFLRPVMNPEAVDAVTGHSNPRNAGANYGVGFRGRPDEVLKDVDRIPSPMPPLGQAGEGQEAGAGQERAPSADKASDPPRPIVRAGSEGDHNLGRRAGQTGPSPERPGGGH